MVKAVILDVDGVIVGHKAGVNFPLPHKDVIQKFIKVHKSGIPLVLCTAKFGYAIQGTITQAKLTNPHITDGGALIIDPLDNVVIKKHIIEKAIVEKIAKLCLENNVYVELYTPETYYTQKSQVIPLTAKRSHVLQKEPTLVDSLLSIAEKEDIVKMIVLAHNDEDKPRVEKVVSQFYPNIHFIWSQHSYLTPVRPGIITAPEVSKKNASKEVADNLGISFDEILGVGDSKSDWNFMELCKYVATLENGDDAIKELIKTKGEGSYFILPSVDDNGMIAILDHFLY